MKEHLFFLRQALLCLLGAAIAAGAIFAQQSWLGNVSLADSGGKMALDLALFMACVAALMLGSTLIGNAVIFGAPEYVRRLRRRHRRLCPK